MNVLITGADGFVGRNLAENLYNIRDGKDPSHPVCPGLSVFRYDIDTDPALLEAYCEKADFVFNLAGVNRPKDPSEFMAGNFGFASVLLDTLKKHRNTCPVMLASSTQVALENPYGSSKKAGEELFFRYAEETGAKVLVYRFPNIFGKWCRPNYNSAVATFCYNIARGLPITVTDRDAVLRLVYIDDVVAELIRALNGGENGTGDFCEVPDVYAGTLGEITDLLHTFKAGRDTKAVPDMGDAFIRKLYATYLSYLPEDQFDYELSVNSDRRGSFTELIRTPDRGQFSVNIIRPGVTKGNHWHNTKTEKFAVAGGSGVIRFRRVGDEKVHEYFVSGDQLRAVDIPPGYTHHIENLGDTDMITFIWASEPFDPARPDTFMLEV